MAAVRSTGVLAGTGLRFTKGHGTENDFVVLPDPDGDLELTPALVRALCDRRTGVGGDGVLRVVLTAAAPEVAHLADEARWFMDYRNADGSLAEMCGNGIRVYARYLVDAGYARPGSMRLATRDGVRAVELAVTGQVTVDMGWPRLFPDEVAVRLAGRDLPAQRVDLGNPHAVVVTAEPVGWLDLGSPPQLRAEEFPDGGNVEFVRELADGVLALRAYERGAGETRSCGTGACAAVSAVRHRARAAGPATYRVQVPGGQLTVNAAPDGRLRLAGPAVLVADGELRPEWLAGALKRSAPDTTLRQDRDYGDARARRPVSPSQQ